MSVHRRQVLTWGVSAALVGCSRRDDPEAGIRAAWAGPSPSAPPPPLPEVSVPMIPARAPQKMRLERWTLTPQDLPPPPGAARAEVAALLPEGPPGARYPLVIALHGRGEARKDPREGALGWPRDYLLGRAHERLAAPPLTPADFEHLATSAELRAHNDGLAAHPYRGVVVLCPYTPDVELGGGPSPPSAEEVVAGQRPFGAWLVRELLPFARRRLPVFPTAAATGIDGISLGGHLALRYGFLFPEAFGAVSGLQPALLASEASAWASLAQAARAKNPNLAIRLLTSDRDYFRDAVRACDRALGAAVPHRFEEVHGPHDYAFNRGPGAIALLRFHDEVLARA